MAHQKPKYADFERKDDKDLDGYLILNEKVGTDMVSGRPVFVEHVITFNDKTAMKLGGSIEKKKRSSIRWGAHVEIHL